MARCERGCGRRTPSWQWPRMRREDVPVEEFRPSARVRVPGVIFHNPIRGSRSGASGFQVPGGFESPRAARYGKDFIMDWRFIEDRLVGVQKQAGTLVGLGADDERVNKRTEAGLCKVFRRMLCGVEGDSPGGLMLADEDGQLYGYNGRWYELVTEEALLELVIRVMERLDVGIVYQTGSAKAARDYCVNALVGESRCRFVPDRRWVCFTNGVYDVREGRLLGFGPEYVTDMVMDYAFDAEARSRLWEDVLARTVPDPGMRSAFRQFCGCMLADRREYTIEYITFVVGEGQNGKSVICKAVVNTLGRRVASSYNPEQLFRSTQRDYHLADVNGKVVNYCDDVSNKDFSGGDFKMFVSGAPFTGRHPYSRRPTRVDKVPLMLCCANKIPPTTDDSEGYFRRFLVILAPNRVDDRDKDPQLVSKLAAPEVKAAIFDWMLEGYREFVANGGKIDVPQSVRDVVEEMKASANSLRRWLDTEGYVAAVPRQRSGEGWRPLKEWVQEYINYCKDWGEVPRSRSSVTDMFAKMGAAKVRRGDGMWYYLERRAELPEEEKDVMADLPF